MKIEWKCSSRISVRIQISRSTILPVSRLSIALMLDTVPLEMDSYQVYSALCVYNDVRVKVFFVVFGLNWDVGSCASKHKYTHTHTIWVGCGNDMVSLFVVLSYFFAPKNIIRCNIGELWMSEKCFNLSYMSL